MIRPRYYLTPEEKEQWQSEGLLAKVEAGGEIVGPAEIVTVTVEQSELIEQIKRDMAKVKPVAIHGRRFGTAPLLSMVHSVVNARSVMRNARVLDPNCAVIDALNVFRRAAEFLSEMTAKDSLRFFDQAATALIDRDARFFREVADLLNEGAGKDRRDRWTIDLQKAFHSLLGKVHGVVPTKKQVKNAATLDRAIDDLWAKRKSSPYTTRREFAAAERNRIEARQQLHLIGSNTAKSHKLWSFRFKKAGLGSLPTDRGGQPAVSRRRIGPPSTIHKSRKRKGIVLQIE